MKGLKITFQSNGEAPLVLDPGQRFEFRIEAIDSGRVISLWAFDDREDGLATDPRVMFSLGDDDTEPQITAFPITGLPVRGEVVEGQSEWWEYDL